MSDAHSSTAVCIASRVSYRVLDYWAREGAITPSIADGDGSGRYRRWSDLDVARVVAIGEVARDLNALGFDMALELVEDLWRRLTTHPDVLICQGTVTISASRAPV